MCSQKLNPQNTNKTSKIRQTYAREAKPKKEGVLRQKDVLSDRDFFANIGVWPGSLIMDPKGWLENFSQDDNPLALELLNSFTYFNSSQVQKLISTGFMRIGSLDLDESNVRDLESRWEKFCQDVVVSYPVSIPANPSDSGHMFVRVLREQFDINDEQICEPTELLRKLIKARHPFPVVFVDDFSGTGTQFIRTVNEMKRVVRWRRKTSVSAELARLGAKDAYCVSAVITEPGRIAIHSKTGFRVSGGNVLPSTASVLDKETHLVPPAMRPKLKDFIERYSRVAGIRAEEAFGFRRSGLAIAFDHGTPNNTLPIFSWQENGWKPLIVRP